MCFNETASITAFTIGSVCLAYTFYKKMYVFSFLYVTIVLMQLVEYYAHVSLNTNNTKLNKSTAKAGAILLIIQPIIWSLYVSYAHTKDKNIQNMILIVSIMFILFNAFLFKVLDKANGFRYTYLHDKCSSSVCRLKWNFMSTSTLGSFMCLSFYMFLFGYPYFLILKHKIKNITYFSVTWTLLVLSLIYMILCDKVSGLKELFSGFGSIWCFLCIFAGPFMIAFPEMATSHNM
jgi:hypothetical protein